MNQNISVRYVQMSDAGSVAALIYETSLACCFTESRPCPEWFKESVHVHEIEKLMSDECMTWLVALLDGRVVGVLAVKDKRHLTYFFVTPSCQNMGVGRTLWQSAFQKGALVNPVSVRSSLNAVAVYERLGFVLVETPKIYKGLHYQTMVADIV